MAKKGRAKGGLTDWFKEKWRVKKGGGPLGINLVHDIDLICYLLGPVDYVQASSSNKIRKHFS